jgi:hypothetical protein
MDINALYNNNEYWYIAFCVTPWHIMGVKSFVENKLQEAPELHNKKGALIILPHPKTGYCINEDSIKEIDIPLLSSVIFSTQDCNKIDPTRLVASLKNIFIYRKDTIQKRFIISTLEPYTFCEIFNYNGLRNELVLIDEGVSSYTSFHEYIKHSFIESRSRKYEFKLFFRLVTEVIIRSIFSIRVSDWLLFNKTDGFSVNQTVSSLYKKNYKVSDVIPINKKGILYLSQPPVTEQEKTIIPLFITELASICYRNNITLYIKPHPRDSIDYFESVNGVSLVRHIGPVESIFPRMVPSPLFVIGFRSTALLTLKAFYEVDCISIIELLSKEYNKKENSDDKFFYRSFLSLFHFPKDLQSLELLITQKLLDGHE